MQQQQEIALSLLGIRDSIHPQLPYYPPLFGMAAPSKPAHSSAAAPSAQHQLGTIEVKSPSFEQLQQAKEEEEQKGVLESRKLWQRHMPKNMKAPSRGKKLPQPLGDSSEHPFYLESKYRSGLPTSAWNTLRIVPEQQEQLQQMPLGKQQQQQKEQDSLHTGSQQQQQQQQQQHAGAEAQPQPTLDETPDNPYDNMIRVLTNELAQVKASLLEKAHLAQAATEDISSSIDIKRPIMALAGLKSTLQRDINLLLKQKEQASMPEIPSPATAFPRPFPSKRPSASVMPTGRSAAPHLHPSADQDGQPEQQQQQQPHVPDLMDMLAGPADTPTPFTSQPWGSSSSSSSVFWPQSPAAHSQSLWQRPARDAAARLQQTGLKGKQQRQLPENERARRRREEEMLVNIYGRELEVEDSKLQEVQRQRAAKQAAKDLAARTHEDELEEDGAARPPSSQRQGGLFPQHVPRTIEIPAVVSVRQLAELLDCRPAALEAFLAEQLGEPPGSLEDLVAPEAAELAALEWGHVAILQQGTERPLSPRPPVITIMGHVDHGKTSLLDALRNTSVAASEAGGITQHIGAFEVVLPELGNAPLTFLDTPGHSAFSAMRARGAAVTDIVVLVVAADDGIMPQTREALAHASAAGCPIVVALTKCDLQQAKPNAVKQALMVEGLEIEDFGGSVQVVHTSARTGAGLNDLAEALQLQAEMAELQADAEGPAQGVVVEASNSKAGPQVALIVRSGRLRVGDTIVVGTEYGKVRALRGTSRKATAEGVGPGQHALVTGLKGLPQAGDSMTVVADEDRARRISYARSQRAEEYRHLQSMAALHAQRAKESDHMAKLQGMKRELRVQRMALLAQRKQKTAQQLAELSAKHKQAQQEAQAASSAPSPTTAGKLIPRGLTTPTPATEDSDSEQGTEGKEHAQQQPAQQQQQQQQQQPKRPLRLVVKADVQGSMEAVLAMVRELAADRVDLKVLHSGVGQLTPNDVNLALASGAHVVSFNLGPTNAALEKAMSQAGAAGVKFISHNIVYHLMTQIESLIEGTKMHEIVEQVIGEASVQSTFAMSTSGRKKVNLPPGGGRIAGVRVTEGSVQRSAPLVRVIRDGQLIYEGACSSMKRHKQDVDAVGAGTECGIVIDDGRFSDFQPGDTLQFVTSITQKIN